MLLSVTWQSLVGGFAVSVVSGAIVLWIAVDVLARPYAAEATRLLRVLEKKKEYRHNDHGRLLPPVVGAIERLMYMWAFMFGMVAWVALWLGVKAISMRVEGGHGSKAPFFNVFLIGNALAVCFGLLGAMVARWSLTPWK